MKQKLKTFIENKPFEQRWNNTVTWIQWSWSQKCIESRATVSRGQRNKLYSLYKTCHDCINIGMIFDQKVFCEENKLCYITAKNW